MPFALFARDAAPPALGDDPPRAAPGGWLAQAVLIAGGIGYVLDRALHRSELVAPIDPGLHAFAIFVGVFAGVLIAAGYAAQRRRRAGGAGLGGRELFGLVAAMVGIPAVCCVGASYAARRLVEYRAFHGVPAAVATAQFTVVGTYQHKSSPYVEVKLAPGDRTIALHASYALYEAAQPGDHIPLPVQTGRGGVRRVVAGPTLQRSDLNHF